MIITLQSLLSLLINVVYSVFAMGLAIGSLWALDRYIFKEIDFIKEIKGGNMAVAIFAGFLLLSVCLILSFTMR